MSGETAQYTFGPPPGAGPTQKTPEQKKQEYTFGAPGQKPVAAPTPAQPQGGGNAPPPAPTAAPVVAKPSVAPAAVPAPVTAPRPAPKAPTTPVDFHTPSFLKGFIGQSGFDPAKLQAVQQFHMGDKVYNMEHPYVRIGAEGVKEAAQGMGKWMSDVYDAPTANKMASKLVEPVIAPLDNLARMVEFHTGKNWDAFGLHNAGVDESGLEEIAHGFKAGDSHRMAEGAGKIAGALATVMMMKEAPKITEDLTKLPGAIKETASIAEEARKKNQSVVTAAANNTLHNDVKTNIAPTLAQADKNVGAVIGQHVKIIADADRAASLASGTTPFTRAGVAQAVQQAVTDVRGTTVPKPELIKVVKNLNKFKPNMSWEDLKDFRAQLYQATQNATGKDKAALGKLQEWADGQLSSRAKSLGKGDNYSEYTDITRKRGEYQRGILNDLRNAETGLKTYKELAKESNKPQLNDMFHLMESHGGLPSGWADDLVKSRKPIYELAARADGGDSSGGRLGALLRHPAAAGTAMVGTGLAVGMSPVPLTGSFVASLIAAQKAANFMDRFDAVKAMRKIRGQAPPNLLKGMPTPFPGGPGTPPPTPPGGAAPGGPSSVAPTGMPQTPTPSGPVPSGGVSPQVAYGLNKAPGSGVVLPASGTSTGQMLLGGRGVMEPSAAGVPAPPVDLQSFLDKVNAAKQGAAPAYDVATQGERRLSRPVYNAMHEAEISTIRDKLKDPKLTTAERGTLERQLKDRLTAPVEEETKQTVVGAKKQAPKMSKEEALAEQKKRQGDTPVVPKTEAQLKQEIEGLKAVANDPNAPAETKANALKEITATEGKLKAGSGDVKQTPYEKFGVKPIDKSVLTTPEAVTAAKKDAVAQIEDLARNKFKEIQKIHDVTERQTALKNLEKEVKDANRSVQKMQTPEVGRAARDRARKAETALKTAKLEGPEGSMIDNLNEEELRQKAAHGVTDHEEAMMQAVDIGRDLEKFNSPIINGVVQKIYAATGGDYRLVVPQLRSLLEQLQKAKKPE